MNNWQPIETAPKGSGPDGPQDRKHPEFVDSPSLFLWTSDGMIIGYCDWYYHPGYGHGACDDEPAWRRQDGGAAYTPTHWQPLPEPPQ